MIISGTLIGLTFIIIGIIGCVMPLLPGPQIAYIGLLVFHFMAGKPFSLTFIIVWLLVIILAIIIDQFLPILTTKKLGGSKSGMRGAGIGAFIGIFGGVIGILIGPFIGAFLGEFWRNKNWIKSLKPALGSFIGIAMSGVIKIALCISLGRSLLTMANQLL